MQKIPAAIHAEDIGIPNDLLKHTLPYSTFYRDRYDFVFVMNILGVIEEITDMTLKDYQKEKQNWF